MKQYEILVNAVTYERVLKYLKALQAGESAGAYVQQQLQAYDLSHMSVKSFLEVLMRTKRPCIFAESAVAGNGTDWNREELSILGDIGVATPVSVYDDGKHVAPAVYEHPFTATLLFIPGALLQSRSPHLPADWNEVIHKNALNPKAYHALYHRRLYPLFCYANHCVGQRGKVAFITIPGLGCGQFAGRFRGQLGHELKQALITFLERYGPEFPHIHGVYYDPYRECNNERYTLHHITFLVRPLLKGNEQKPQLCTPSHYEEEGDHYAHCELFSVVAWDHVSWPGNDFYGGARATDDGVKAAATNSMAVMTGMEGVYDPQQFQYCPPAEYRHWKDVIATHGIQLEVQENLRVFSMLNSRNLFQTRRWPVLAVAVVVLLYAITNWLCVFSPSIQSYGMFLFWGLILPVLFSLGSWFFLFKQRHRYLRWWIAGIIVTVGYVSMGCFTIFIFFLMCATGI